jgi:RNA-directed DNA polymerase
MRVFYSLYDRLLSSKVLKMAFRKVKSAKGAAGIDGQSVHDFAEQEDENVAQLVSELRSKTYRPHSNRQVIIPKDNGGRASSRNSLCSRPCRSASPAESAAAYL